MNMAKKLLYIIGGFAVGVAMTLTAAYVLPVGNDDYWDDDADSHLF